MAVALTLDLDTLRTLVTAVDLGGYGQAADRLGRTPSAVSLQMKRLQTDAGATLFRRQGRGVALSEAGEMVLRYARRMLELNDELVDALRGASLAGSIRLGVSQDFAETMLPDVLAQFAGLYPLVQMEVRIEGNAALVDAVDKGGLDLALVVGHADRPTAETIGALDLVWIAGREHARTTRGPLPLVMLGPQCAFRKTAIARLDEAGLPWRLAATSPSLSGLWASALGGLGVTARTALGLPRGLIWRPTLFGLPALGSFPVTLHLRRPPADAGVGVDRLAAIIREIAADTLPQTAAATAPGARPRSARSRRPTPARAS